MINVLMVVPNRQDATSLYRSMGPFSDMRKQHEFNMVFTDNVDWSILNMVDVVFIQRAFAPQHRQLAELCKLWNVPLWVDYDDLLFDIPTDNPAYPVYMDPKTHNDIVSIIKLATVVTVSTQQLKDCLQLKQNSLNDRVYVVENALMDRLLIRKQPYVGKPLICWRGSNTHQRDLAAYAGPMIDVAKERPDTTWNFVGYNPWFLTDAMGPKQAIVAPPMAIGEYFDYMSRINPSIQIVPLDKSMFNQCKSNIAWIEGALVGAVAIAPDWPEWRKPGVLTYSNEDDFKACIQFALDSPEAMAEYHAQSMAHIQEHLLLSHVNKKRLDILLALHSVSRSLSPLWPVGGDRPQTDETMELE